MWLVKMDVALYDEALQCYSIVEPKPIQYVMTASDMQVPTV